MIKKIIIDVTNSLFLSFKAVYLEQSNYWNFSNMKFPRTEFGVPINYLMQIHLFDCCNMTTIKRKKLK